MKRVAVITGLLALLAAALVTMGAGSDQAYQVRAIFDNAAFAVEGEDVKSAGVRIGKIADLEVTPDNRAAVVLDIEDPAFQDFRRDARCKVRPQSLIGEEYIECTPTQPRAPGQPLPPKLDVIEDGPGEGQLLLPVENTSASVDLDLIGEALRRPQRERLSIIINELGVGLAGRGEDLNEVIKRANPALAEVGGVLRLLARQNDTLERLAVDSDRIMAELAPERERISGFIENSAEVAEATAERREALEANLERLPRFLRELEPTMARLGSLADEMTPVVSDLGAQAPQINRLIRQLGPFSRAGTVALNRLGDVAEPGIPAIRDSLPIVRDLRELGVELRPVAELLRQVLVSFEKNEGLERLMDWAFFQATSVNGFDTAGHFLRVALLVNVCSNYAVTPVTGCSANFNTGDVPAARAAQDLRLSKVLRDTAAILNGADPDEVLGKDRKRREPERPQDDAADTPTRETPVAQEPAPSADAPPAAPAVEPEPAATPQPDAVNALLDYLLGGDG